MKSLLTTLLLIACANLSAKELTPLPAGPYPVASTNMQISDEHRGMSDEEMHEYLLGDWSLFGSDKYVTGIMKHLESVWVVDVGVPDEPGLYGPVSGETFDVVSYVTYPTKPVAQRAPYDFPYHNSNYGSFEHMLAAGEQPELAEGAGQFPLVVLSHGSTAHGIFDIEHANAIARHGYIVAVVTYGEERFQSWFGNNEHVQFLRPLVTKSVIDSLLNSEAFGPYIDKKNIAVSGFSFGGFTALATAGGRINGEEASAYHPLVSAAIITAPWTGHEFGGKTFHAFGPNNESLANIEIPIMALYGTQDEVTPAEVFFPALKQLKGPIYVVELIDQTHNFESGAWEDRNNWEILFLNAYLKNDSQALEALTNGSTMQGGSGDRQRFEYQKSSGDVPR